MRRFPFFSTVTLCALAGVGPGYAQTAPAGTTARPDAPAPAVDGPAAPKSPAAPVAASGEAAPPAAKQPSEAAAQPTPAGAGTKAAPPSPTAAAADAASIRVEKSNAGKLFRITEGMLVEGQRQKPNAFYVLQRASTPYDWEALDERFLPRIIKATEKPPF